MRGDGNTPLWLACASDAPADARIAIAEALLAAGAEIRNDGAGGTALHAAAARGPLALVELLIRHGALEWQGDRKGRPPLAAAKKGEAAEKAAIVELLDRPVIRDRAFRAAVEAIRRGDVAGLARLLDAEPRLLRERILGPACYREADRPQYFRDPKLFWFIANNPTLMKRMPDNIVEVAEAMIARGVDKADLDYALELVMTSSPAREQGLQIPLVELLLRAGATATTRAIAMTLGHRELAPILALLQAGHEMTAAIAAALGRTDRLAELLRLRRPTTSRVRSAWPSSTARPTRRAWPSAPAPIPTVPAGSYAQRAAAPGGGRREPGADGVAGRARRPYRHRRQAVERDAAGLGDSSGQGSRPRLARAVGCAPLGQLQLD